MFLCDVSSYAVEQGKNLNFTYKCFVIGDILMKKCATATMSVFLKIFEHFLRCFFTVCCNSFVNVC